MADNPLGEPGISAHKEKPTRPRHPTKVAALRDAPMMPHVRSGNSKYKPEYCELIITLGKQGKSRIQCASVLNIDRNTLANWERQYPAFGQALARAMVHSQDWWEAKAQQSLGKKTFQAQLWRYSMAGRFKEDYADRPTSSLADALPDFLQAITDAANARRLAAAKAQPGDDAQPIEPLDVVATKP